MEKNIKISEIEFDNHVVLENMICKFDRTYTEIIGLNGTGKSSIMAAIWQTFEGIAAKGPKSFPADRFKFIGDKGKSSSIRLVLIDTAYDNAKIIVDRKFTKAGNAKLVFKAPDDYPISEDWLTNLFSVAFFSPKNFSALSAKEQALLLDIDTAEFDEKLKNLKSGYSEINSRLKAIGEIEEVEKTESVNVQELLAKKRELEEAAQEKFEKIKRRNAGKKAEHEYKKNAELERKLAFENQQKGRKATIENSERLLASLIISGYKGAEVREWINSLPLPEEYEAREIPAPTYEPEILDRSDVRKIDVEIAEASERNVRAGAYRKYLKDVEKRDAIKKELADNKTERTEVQNKRIAFIKARKLPIQGLSIDENGGLQFAYPGEQPRELRAPYFSTGQLMKIIPQLLASRNPDMKIVFLDDFDLFDEENQKKIPEWLIKKRFQVIVAKVGKSRPGKNIITLSPVEDDAKNEDREEML